MDSENEDADQPRPPRNLQDVLRYAIEAGNGSAETAPQPVGLNPESREFLEGAINSIAVDSVKLLSSSIEVLKGLKNDTVSPETYENALDNIAEYIDNIDAANDYVKLGGFTIVDNCLQSGYPGIRWRITDIIGQCTQNNPYCQDLALDLKLVEPLIVMADKDEDERCKTKAFFAVSNVVRDSPTAMKEFMRLNGFSIVKKAIESDVEKLRSKAIFFVSVCVVQHPSVIWDVASMGFPELLISLLQKETNRSHEYVASSLLVIVKENQEALIRCKKPDLQLETTLRRIINDHKSDDSHDELVEHAKELLRVIFK